MSETDPGRMDIGAEASGADAGPRERQLAAAAGMDVAAFVELFGAGWSSVDDDVNPRVRSLGWSLSGTPPQLMLALSERGIHLASPASGTDGTGAFFYEPADERVFPYDAVADPQEIESVIDTIVQSRCESFAYCRYCRILTPPEFMEAADVCLECSEQWLR